MIVIYINVSLKLEKINGSEFIHILFLDDRTIQPIFNFYFIPILNLAIVQLPYLFILSAVSQVPLTFVFTVDLYLIYLI